jgi:hypothetical protein
MSGSVALLNSNTAEARAEEASAMKKVRAKSVQV